jgi:hypothetical protein
MVGGAFDLLDPGGLCDREAVGQRAQFRGRRCREGGQFGDARLRSQGQQPFDFDFHPGLDQAVLGEDRAQGIDLACIAAIER